MTDPASVPDPAPAAEPAPVWGGNWWVRQSAARRAVSLLLFVAVVAVLVVVARTTPERPVATFSERPDPWVPAVELGVSDAPQPTAWFCPGMPAGNDNRRGEVTIVNRSDRELTGRVTVLAAGDEPAVDHDVVIDPWGTVLLEVTEDVDARFASAFVELDDVAGLVEQRAVHPDGDAAAPCTTEVSSDWYLADGFTAGGSRNHLVLTNPYEEDAVISLQIATESGSRSPVEYQGYPIPARSVEVIDLASLGARNEEVLAAHVGARGRVVVGRSQQFEGAGRQGYTMSLASPTLADQWWFALGERGDDVTEEYRIYNPTDDDVEVTAVPLGVAIGAPPGDDESDGEGADDDAAESEGVLLGTESLTVSGGTVARLDTDSLPEGPHGMLFNTSVADERSIVVERVMTRTSTAGEDATDVSLGLPRREDADLPLEWYIPRAPAEATEDALTLHNLNASADIAVAVYRIGGPDGFTPVPGLDTLTLRAGDIATIDLTHRSIGGEPLVVTATHRVLVERSIPRDGSLGGTTTAWGVPRSDGPEPEDGAAAAEPVDDVDDPDDTDTDVDDADAESDAETGDDG